jgi:hypothetical protein
VLDDCVYKELLELKELAEQTDIEKRRMYICNELITAFRQELKLRNNPCQSRKGYCWR